MGESRRAALYRGLQVRAPIKAARSPTGCLLMQWQRAAGLPSSSAQISSAASSKPRTSTCPSQKEELESLEAEANRSIDLKEFIPLSSVDPVYFENTHYLGDDVAHWAIVLIAHARAAFIMQQVKRDIPAMCSGMNADGDRH
jgi:hypothetical protein